MSMSKKDYVAIAGAFKAQLEQDLASEHRESRRRALAETINRMLPYLRASSDTFDSNRFVQACGFDLVIPVSYVFDERFALVA